MMTLAIPLSFVGGSVVGHSVLFASLYCSSRHFIGIFNTRLTLDREALKLPTRVRTFSAFFNGRDMRG
mgnify:CR=1 FL=1